MGRFINADALVSTGQGILGNNMFAYCNNNPVNFSDPSGNVCGPVCFPVTIESGKKLSIIHNVPLYDQTKYNLCWAFSQIMIEDYKAGISSTQAEATQKAIELAKSVNGEKNIFGEDKWNQGAFPTNLGKKIYPDTMYDLYALLQSGPLYAYYCAYAGDPHPHMVVVTGVDLSTGLVHINNPWGMSGTQTFEEFLCGCYGNTYDSIVPLRYVYPAK